MDLVPRDRVLFDCIGEHPGVHLRGLARRAGITLGVTHERLGALERQGLIEARIDGRYKRYFVKSALPASEMHLLIAFRTPRAREIVSYLLAHGSATQRELVRASDASRGAVAPALRTLVDRGIVASTRVRRENAYRLADPQTAAAVLHRYRTTLAPRALPDEEAGGRN
jgi:predicted transcriptional regulator